MTLPAACFTSAQISALFGHTDPEWFADNKATLISRNGFPPPLPKPGRPRWSRAQVERWFQYNGCPPAGPQGLTDPHEDDPETSGSSDRLPGGWAEKLLGRIEQGEGVK